MEQLTREQAIAFHDSEAWKEMTDVERAAFQLNQECLCMPFAEFHRCVGVALGRPVWTHEFAFSDKLREEMNGKAKAPTFDEILAMLPKENHSS